MINPSVFLSNAGISGNCFKLMVNYLDNRKQYCMINNLASKHKRVTFGIPQGSTLGPLLLIIYVNDATTFINKVNVLLYADARLFIEVMNQAIGL